MSQRPEGFEVALHRSLTQPILLAGAPRSLAIANATLAASVGLGLQMWLSGLVLLLGGHALAVFAAKRDPNFVDVLLRHIRQRGQYEC